MRRCDICNGDDIAILLDNLSFSRELEDEGKEWRYRLLRCRNCGLGFVDPKPSWERLCSFYEGGYAGYAVTGGNVVGGKGLIKCGRGLIKYWLARCRYATYRKSGVRELVQTACGLIAEWITGRTVPFTFGIPVQLPKDSHIFCLEPLGIGILRWPGLA